jgi:hypothetical protein
VHTDLPPGLPSLDFRPKVCVYFSYSVRATCLHITCRLSMTSSSCGCCSGQLRSWNCSDTTQRRVANSGIIQGLCMLLKAYKFLNMKQITSEWLRPSETSLVDCLTIDEIYQWFIDVSANTAVLWVNFNCNICRNIVKASKIDAA